MSEPAPSVPEPQRAELSTGKKILRFLRVYWRAIVVVAVPILFSPIPIIYNKPPQKCLYVVILMAMYWVTEALPLPITAMLPVVLFPTMGILDSESTCKAYMKGTNMMFIGGLMIAAGLEHSKLHKRVALRTIQIVGCSHRRLTFGLALVTMFLSMWISNSAATTMMVPITLAILEVLEQQGLGEVYLKKTKDVEGQNAETQLVEKAALTPEDEEPPEPSRSTVCYLLLIAFSSSIGGSGTLVGTGTNMTFKGIYEGYFPKAPQIDFPRFMLYQVPPMLVQTFLIWVYMQCMYMGMFRPKSEAYRKCYFIGKEYEEKFDLMDKLQKEKNDKEKELMAESPAEKSEKSKPAKKQSIWSVLFCRKRSETEDANQLKPGERGALIAKKVVDAMYVDLGPMTWHETAAGMLFIVAVLLFFLRSPGFMPGWADILTDMQVKDAVTAMLIVILMFVIPANLDFLKYFRSGTSLPNKPSPGVVTWKVLNSKTPWGLLFLLGGGFALAEGSSKSGMSSMLGDSLAGLRVLPSSVILLIVIIICEVFTEFTSNVAVCNIILPVLAEMSVQMEIHPLYMMMPAAIACSMSFHMPVGTPPNAIVAGAGNIKNTVMAVAGIGPTLLTTVITWVTFPVWGVIIHPEVKEFPSWAVKK